MGSERVWQPDGWIKTIILHIYKKIINNNNNNNKRQSNIHALKLQYKTKENFY